MAPLGFRWHGALIRFPVRQSFCPVWRRQPWIAGHFTDDRSSSQIRILLRELQYRDDRTTRGPIVAVNRALFCGDAAADRPVKPEVLEAPGVVIAVHHCRQPFETRHAAVRGLGVE